MINLTSREHVHANNGTASLFPCCPEPRQLQLPQTVATQWPTSKLFRSDLTLKKGLIYALRDLLVPADATTHAHRRRCRLARTETSANAQAGCTRERAYSK